MKKQRTRICVMTVSLALAGLGLTLALPRMVLSVSAPHSEAGETSQARSMAAPWLGTFINIWIESGVDNVEPAMAYNNLRDEYLVVWTDERPGGVKDVHARRVSGDGLVRSEFVVAHNAGSKNYEPDVAYSPVHDEYLIVYTFDEPTTDSDIWARRVKWDGSDLWQPQYQEFAIRVEGGKQHHPAVAYNSDADEYLVVYQNTWFDRNDIAAQRVRAGDGGLESWRNIASDANQYRNSPDVAYCPTSNYYLIAYEYGLKIHGKVASWNMDHLGPETKIGLYYDQSDVALAASATEFLAVFSTKQSAGDYPEICARRMSADGTPEGWTEFVVAGGSITQGPETPSVAYGAGYGYLVVYHSDYLSSDYNVYGSYVMPGQDGTAGSSFVLDDDSGSDQRHPVVACATNGDCLMAEGDAVGGDFDIRGRLVVPHHVYLPLVLRDW